MGYFVELNTLLRPPKNFDFKSLQIGQKYKVILDRERVFPLHIAILLIDSEWNFYGYCIAHSAELKDQKTKIEFEVISLFSPEEQEIYKKKFLDAAKVTGEVK